MAELLEVGGGGGGGGGVSVPNRRDHSVNGGAVDDFTKTPCILRTNTNVNNAGAFNGGGIGNKGILGHFLTAPLLLSALARVQLDYELLAPENGTGPLRVPYLNAIVEFDPAGAPGVYSVLVFGDPNSPPALNLGVFSSLGGDKYRTVWTAANYVSVVVFKGTLINSLAPGIPPATIPPDATVGAAWPNNSYSIPTLLAQYPNARIVNASSGDGGLPKNTITAGLLAILGDSGTVIQNAVRINAWLLNGSNI